MNELPTQIIALLDHPANREQTLASVLQLLLTHFNSETGTLHRLDAEKQTLHLLAQIGLPPQLLPVISVIPVGKGIAGETAARGEPVTICNLQTDSSGVAKPGAKQTGVGGALCVPVRNGNQLIGTLGIGTARAYQYTPEETRALEEIGRLLGPRLAA